MPEPDPAERTETLRRCSLCGEYRPLSQFHRRGTGYQRWRRRCRKKWDAAYHARTKPIRLEQKRGQKRRLREWMRELKASQPCADCGGRFHPAAMTFDHLPEHKKLHAIAQLVVRGCAALARLEVLRCEIVCANCHAIRTYERREAKKHERNDSGLSLREAAGIYFLAGAHDVQRVRGWPVRARHAQNTKRHQCEQDARAAPAVLEAALLLR